MLFWVNYANEDNDVIVKLQNRCSTVAHIELNARQVTHTVRSLAIVIIMSIEASVQQGNQFCQLSCNGNPKNNVSTW